MNEDKDDQLGVKSIGYTVKEELSQEAFYYGNVLIPGAEREQNEFDNMLKIFKKYRPRKDFMYKKLKDDLVINVKNFHDGREMIIDAFKDKIFLRMI